MGAALLPLAIGGAGIAGGQYMKYKAEQDALKQASATGNTVTQMMGNLGGAAHGANNPFGMKTTALATRDAVMTAAARSPQIAQTVLPQILQEAFRGPATPEYGTTPQTGINPTTKQPDTYVVDKTTGQPRWLGVAPQAQADKPNLPAGMEIVNGRVQPIPGFLQATAQAEAAKRAPEKPPAPKDTFDDEAKLRAEYNKQAESYIGVRDAFGRIVNLYQNQDPKTPGPSQTGIIYGYIKMLDPATGVKEGEIATQENSRGLPGWVVTAYNKSIGGGADPQTIGAIVDAASNLYKQSETSYLESKNFYEGLSKRKGLSPENTVQDFRRKLPGPKDDRLKSIYAKYGME